MTARLAGVQAVDWKSELFARLPVRHAPDNARGRRATGGAHPVQAGAMLPQLTGPLSKTKAHARGMASQRCRTAAVARVSRGTGGGRAARPVSAACGRARPQAVWPKRRRWATFVRFHPPSRRVRSAAFRHRARGAACGARAVSSIRGSRALRRRTGMRGTRARVRAGEPFARRNLTGREPRRSVAHDLRDREGARWTIAGWATRGLRESMSRRSRLPRSIGSLSMHRPRPIGHRISGGWQKRARCRAPALPFV